MANTISIKTTPYGSGRYLQLDCTQTKDIATNTSTIKWTLTSTGGTSNYFSTGPTTVTINGTQVYYKERLYYKDGSSLPFPGAKGSTSGTLTIKHDDYGNKTISVSLSTAIYTSTVSTYSKNWELDSIPRKATLNPVPNFTDLDNPTITYSNPAGTAVTSLKACIALDSQNIVVPYGQELNKTGNLTYTFDLTNYRDALRNTVTGPSRTVYVYLQSVIGGVYYWHSLPCTLTIKESEATKPSVTIGVTLNNSNLPSGFEGLYIQNKSRVDVTLEAQGKYNASINSKYAVIEGATYKTFPLTSYVFRSSGNVPIVGYATDTRGFTNSDTKTVNVIDYSKPLVIPLGNENAILCYRSDGNGKRIGNSTSLWVKVEKFYYPVMSNGVQKNFCALEYRKKLSTEQWDDAAHLWKELISKTNTTNEYNALIPNEVFDTKKSYTVQIRAIDDIGEYDFKTFDIPTADVALHLGRGGKNVSVGSYCDYAEDYTFHSEWKGIFDDGIYGAMGNQLVDDVFDFALNCHDGLTPYVLNGNETNLPDPDLSTSFGFVQKITRTDGVPAIIILLFDCWQHTIWVNTNCLGNWSGWGYIKPQ